MTAADTDLRAPVDALVALAAAAGQDEHSVRAELAALSAAASSGAQGAAGQWADVFDGQPGAFDTAARAGRVFARKATPVLARLVANHSAQASDYAQALAALASAACSLGEPTLSTLGTASVIAAAQIDAVRPAAPPLGQTVTQSPSAAPAVAAVVATATAPDPPAKTLDELLAELDELVGLESVKDEVRHQAEVLRIAKLRTAKDLKDPAMTRHLVFVGNPGTGKTTVARLVAGIYRALGVLKGGQLVECDRSLLVAGYLGQTALKTSDMATKAIGGALFIDEAYALADDDFGHEAIDTLVKQMEDHRGDLVVIVAGYPEPMEHFIHANPGLSSRFRLTLTFDDYSDDQLVEIFTNITASEDFTPTEDCTAKLRQILTLTPRDTGFGNARFVRTLFESAVVRQAWRLKDLTDPTVEQLRELLPDDLGELPDTLHPPDGSAP